MSKWLEMGVMFTTSRRTPKRSSNKIEFEFLAEGAADVSKGKILLDNSGWSIHHALFLVFERKAGGDGRRGQGIRRRSRQKDPRAFRDGGSRELDSVDLHHRRYGDPCSRSHRAEERCYRRAGQGSHAFRWLECSGRCCAKAQTDKA